MIISRYISDKKYYKILFYLIWFIIIFGFIEYFSGVQLWKNLGITKLWELKGIETNIIGIPPNWYSSEKIAGNILKRMVSSFADPVNLGTFLFAAFMISWYRKKKITQAVIFICIVFTVSKGAFLGLLVWIIVYTASKKNTKMLVPVVALCVLCIGVYFIIFSAQSSSGSIFAHIYGFLNSFMILKTNPLGLGLGNVGVLAGLFNSSLSNVSVAETGIGMIIAQLGIIGFLIYILFFTHLIILGRKIKYNDVREKIIYYSLLIGFIANAMFNEVALSPNSCGIYFIQLAVIINSCFLDKEL